MSHCRQKAKTLSRAILQKSFLVYDLIVPAFKTIFTKLYKNNLTKGLGKYEGHLRWNFYADCITQIATKHHESLCYILTSGLTCNQKIYRELEKDLENQCLKCLHNKRELSQTLAYKVTIMS